MAEVSPSTRPGSNPRASAGRWALASRRPARSDPACRLPPGRRADVVGRPAHQQHAGDVAAARRHEPARDLDPLARQQSPPALRGRDQQHRLPHPHRLGGPRTEANEPRLDDDALPAEGITVDVAARRSRIVGEHHLGGDGSLLRRQLRHRPGRPRLRPQPGPGEAPGEHEQKSADDHRSRPRPLPPRDRHGGDSSGEQDDRQAARQQEPGDGTELGSDRRCEQTQIGRRLDLVVRIGRGNRLDRARALLHGTGR